METKAVSVTVICMAYNHERYIRQTLDGFLAQKTDFPVQYLIHEDCSTDGTAGILKEYEEKYPGFFTVLYAPENRYSKGTLGDVIRPLIQGEFCAYCEGDDYWIDPNKLQKQYDFLRTHPEYDACYHANILIDAQTGRQTGVNAPFPESGEMSVEDCILRKKGTPQTATKFVRTSRLRERPEFSYKVSSGDIAVLAWLGVTTKVYYMKDCMSAYRVNVPGSWTQKRSRSPEFRKKHRDGMICFLNTLDDYSHKKYHRIIRLATDKYKFTDDVEEGRFLALPFHKYYWTLRLKQRLYFIKTSAFGKKGKKSDGISG